MTAWTTVTADTVQQAKMMLTRIYGDGTVLNINQLMAEDEKVSEATKTLTSQKLQEKIDTDKAEDCKQKKKALKARLKIAKFQLNWKITDKPILK